MTFLPRVAICHARLPHLRGVGFKRRGGNQWHTPATQDGALAGQSCLFLHWTQVSAWQIGVADGQSVLAAQRTQRPPVSQMGVAVPAHWALVRHCTQDDVVVLQ